MPAWAMIDSVAELSTAIRAPVGSPQPFELAADVSCVIRHRTNAYIIAVREADAHACVYGTSDLDHRLIRPGARLRLKGLVQNAHPSRISYAKFSQMDVLGHTAPSLPADSTIEAIQNGLHDWQFVRVKGLIRDVHPSDTTRFFTIISLAADNETLQVMVPTRNTDVEALVALIGKRISAAGFPNQNAQSWRSFAGREFHCPGMSAITVLDDNSEDVFHVPDAETLLSKTTAQISTMGRVKVRGRVICSWDGRKSLVKTTHGDFVTLVTSDRERPGRASFIEATGLPNSNFFHITLTDARWRTSAPLPIEEAPVREISASLLSNRELIRAELHGNPVSLEAVVRNLPDDSIGQRRMLVSSDASLLSVDVSAAPEVLGQLTPGCRIRLTGIYIMETEYTAPGHTISQFKGFSLALRVPDDLVVISRPPWWTPERLLAVIGSLLVILLGTLIWNTALRRLASKRSDELYAARIDSVKSDLKIDERTRLAAELHDSVAQNMKGLDLLINAAIRSAGLDNEKMMRNLHRAANLLRSCREELRNCLWDFRNRALDETDMASAIRQTLKPVMDDFAGLTIRLDIPRSGLTDNSAHAILRIVRELVSNAIYHGKADRIEIEGSLRDKTLQITVRDDGCGFEPDSAPGPELGHFGLSGVRERLLSLNGTLQIASKPGLGTVCTLTLII